ncbi:MAG: hypothetical protein L0229_14105 [Blastocatellia bacterium]|nr:hypothetical protein [Blastocatellia bacterium]
MRSRKIMPLLVMVLLVAMSSAVSAATFNNAAAPDHHSDPVSGKYQGTAKGDSVGELPLTVEIKNMAGKLSGSIDTPNGPAPITGGTFADGKVTMTFDAGGAVGTITGMLKEGVISGNWELGGQTGTFELKKMDAAMPAKGDAKGEMAGDPISGEWDASADAGGMTINFTLKLKAEGEKVTGESVSDQGSLPLSNGSWKDGKLSFALDTPNGAITLTAMIKDGKLVGEYDFAGQATGPWEAKKK